MTTETAEKKKSTWELGNDVAQLTALLEALWNDELPEEYADLEEADIMAALDAADVNFTEKVERVIGFVREHLETRERFLAEEIKRIQARKKATEGNISRLKSMLVESMQKAGKPKIDAARLTVWLQKNPPSLEVADQTKVPEAYIVTPEPVTPPPRVDAAKIISDYRAKLKLLETKKKLATTPAKAAQIQKQIDELPEKFVEGAVINHSTFSVRWK